MPDSNAFKKDKINISLVARLITNQFPQWTDLPIYPVAYCDGTIKLFI